MVRQPTNFFYHGLASYCNIHFIKTISWCMKTFTCGFLGVVSPPAATGSRTSLMTGRTVAGSRLHINQKNVVLNCQLVYRCQ